MNQKIIQILILLFVFGSANGKPDRISQIAGDSAITRVEDCTCFKHIDAQKTEPWNLAWGDAEKLRKQFSHCICRTHIDIRNVENPARYIVPGTVVK